MSEIWKDIKGYEGLYQVSNLGRVYNIKRNKYKKPSKDKDGYLYVGISKQGKSKNYKVHRLVAEAFISNLENKPQVNHIDGNKLNNVVKNLEWVTSKENIIHAHKIGLSYNAKGKEHFNYGKHLTKETKEKMSKKRKGELNSNSKQVRCINTGEIFKYIRKASEYYSVAAESIGRCCSGKSKSAGKHPVTGEKLIWEYVEE